MQEKERFEWDKLEGCEWIRDTEMVNQPLYYDLKTVAHLLNQQDKRIKELELLLKADKKIETNSLNGFEKLRQEIRQLKQSQKQLAISELEKIYNLFEPYENSQKDTILCANNGISFVEYLENQIKSLKGEE